MMTIISKLCDECERSIDLEVHVNDYRKYLGGAFVQDAFPYLSEGDRELLISGICGECFDNMFGNFDEERM